MQKPKLEASIAALSYDEIVKILKDLAADPAIRRSVVTAVELARSSASNGNSVTKQSFFDSISKTIGRKSKPEGITKTSISSSETITPNSETVASDIQVHPGKTSAATSETITPDPKTVTSDIQVCDNCNTMFRLSMPKTFVVCEGHPGRLDKIKKVLQDRHRFEQWKQKAAASSTIIPDECWTCCLGSRYRDGCRRLDRHVCSNPVSELREFSK